MLHYLFIFFTFFHFFIFKFIINIWHFFKKLFKELTIWWPGKLFQKTKYFTIKFFKLSERENILPAENTFKYGFSIQIRRHLNDWKMYFSISNISILHSNTWIFYYANEHNPQWTQTNTNLLWQPDMKCKHDTFLHFPKFCKFPVTA